MLVGFKQTNALMFSKRNNQNIANMTRQIQTGVKQTGSFGQKEQTLTSSQRQSLKAKQRTLQESQNVIQTKNAAGQKVFQGISQSVLDSSKTYSQMLSQTRAKSKDATLQVKKLRYDMKGISSQILRSKTSSNARAAVGKARREVQRLKNLLSQKGYDKEEVQAAITHAQSMERVAKKKERHLLEEELIKAGKGPCYEEKEDRVEDIEKQEEEEQLEEEDLEEYPSEADEEAYEDMPLRAEDLEDLQISIQDNMDALMQISQEELGDMIAEEMSQMMDEMAEELKSFMEDMGLEELTEGIAGTANKDMDPSDLKMLKIKHRCKEMKDMTQADNEYLKYIFDKMAKETTTGFDRPPESLPSIGISVSEAPSVSVGIDISI